MPLVTAVGFVRTAIGIGERILMDTHRPREIEGEGHRLRLASYTRFLDIQNQHMQALRRASEDRLYESCKVLMRTVYEGAVRFAWLAREETARDLRVDRWMECWPLERYRLANELRHGEDEVGPLREQANLIATWIAEPDWAAIRAWWEEGQWPECDQEEERLLKLVDPYERATLGEMKTQFLATCPTPLGDMNRYYKTEYTIMSMTQHWTAFALWRAMGEEAEGQLVAETTTEEDIVDRILVPTIHLYAVFLNDFGAVWPMDVDDMLNALDRDFGAAFRAEAHVAEAGPAPE